MLIQSAPSTRLTQQVCEQLVQYGLTVNKFVTIGRNLMFNGAVRVESNTSLIKAKIDAYSYVQFNCNVTTSEIGRYTSIAHGVEIGMGIHKTDCATTSIAFFRNPYFMGRSGYIPDHPEWKIRRGEETSMAKIGNDVWLGAHVLVPADATIGHGAVIGANTVVTGDVPPYAVVAGNNVTDASGKVSSMRIAKYRFKDEIISDLLELSWWDYDLPKWIAAGNKVPYENINDFISYMHNEDLSSCPRIEDNWKLLFIESSEQARVFNVDKSMSQDFTALNIENGLTPPLAKILKLYVKQHTMCYLSAVLQCVQTKKATNWSPFSLVQQTCCC